MKYESHRVRDSTNKRNITCKRVKFDEALMVKNKIDEMEFKKL